MAILEISWRGMSRKILKILSVIVLNAAAIILVGAVIYMNDDYNYDRYRSNEILKEGNDRTYYIQTNDLCEIKDLSDIEEIGYANFFETGCYYEFDELEDLKNQQSEIYNESGHTRVWGIPGIEIYSCTSVDIFNIYNIKMTREISIESINSEKELIYLYLGSKYKDIEIGTKYKISDECDAIIAGIMEENQKIVSIGRITDKVGEFNEIILSLDEVILGVFEEEYFLYSAFTLKEGLDYETVKEKIRTTFYEKGYQCTVASISEMFDAKDEANGMFVGILRGIMTIIIFSSILISSCIMILDIQKNQKMYGIMSANGFTTSDIIKAIVLENALIMILSIVAAVFITLTQTNTIFGNDVFIRMTSPKLLIFCIALMIIASVAPAIYISRMDTKKMIQGEAV